MFKITKNSIKNISKLLSQQTLISTTSKNTLFLSGAQTRKFGFSSTSTNFSNSLDVFGNSDVESVLHHYSQGDRFLAESKLDNALESYNQVLKLVLNTNGLSFIDLNTVYKNLGNIYLKRRDYDAAIDNYEKCLNIATHQFGEGHFQIGYCLKLIANAFMQQTEWKRALETLEKALGIFKENFEEVDLFLAEVYYDFGLIYQNLGEWDKALEFSQKALKIYELEENSANQLAELHNNIGHIYCESGDLDNAVKSYNSSLEICVKNFGQESVKTAFNYNNLGGLCYEKKEFEKALEFYAKALEGLKRYYGENHFYCGEVYYNMGNVMMKQANYQEALLNYNKAVKIEIKCKEKSIKSLFDFYKAIGIANCELGQWENVLKFNKKALKIAQANYGFDKKDIATVYYNIGRAYDEQDDAKKALMYFQKASESLENKQEDYKVTPHLGQRYYRLGKLGRELVEDLQVLTIEGHSEEESQKVADFLVETNKRTAAIYSKNGQIEKSIEYLENARKICVRNQCRNNLLAAEIYRNLEETYRLQGQQKKASEYRKVYWEIIGNK